AQAVQNTAPSARLLLAGQLTSAAGTGDAATYTGADVKFDASASTDAEGDALTFSWSLTSKPGTSSAAIKGSGSVVTVTPDVAGTYVVTVRITDSKGAFTDKQANLVVVANAAPVSSVAVSASYSAVASTATSRTVTVGASLLFDSTGSRDADGDAVVTTWELTARPAGSAATLAISGKTARVNTDLPGVYQVRARGTDPSGAYSETVYPFEAVGTAPQVVVVTSVENGPVDAGTKLISGTLGYGISLSSAGTNADGTSLTYAWSLVAKPAASAAVLGTPTSAFSRITPDVLGDYQVNLVVTASTGVASSYTMIISVRNRAPVAAIASNATPVALPSGPTLRLPVGTTVT
ncbi:MAG: PKD domain-containing protein, partial [Oxalobacteraceae bacterium]